MNLKEASTEELMKELDERLRGELREVPMRFTYLQIDHICYQIGVWYTMMKPLLEGQNNLGYMKEKLKMMICGD